MTHSAELGEEEKQYVFASSFSALSASLKLYVLHNFWFSQFFSKQLKIHRYRHTKEDEQYWSEEVKTMRVLPMASLVQGSAR